MKLLIISEVIAPASTIASVRWTKIGKYLHRKFNVDIDIVTTKKRYSDSLHPGFYLKDSTLEKDLVFFNRVWEIPEGLRAKAVNWLFATLGALLGRRSEKNEVPNITKTDTSEIKLKKRDEFIKKVYFSAYGLFLRVKGASICHQAKKLKIKWDDYDVIVTSFSPRWVHLLGKWVKDKYPSVVWIADYRDSTLSIVDVPKKEKRSFTHIYTKTADCIIGVSQGVLDNLALPKLQMSKVITNGFDPEDLGKRIRKIEDRFIISYTGTLYDNGECRSDLRPFFIALKELIEEKEVDPSKILVVYAGSNSDIFRDQMRLYKSIIPSLDAGFISRADSYKLQESSSILLLCTWNTKSMQGVVTGKIFEYFSSGVPIAGLCTGDLKNSTVKEMLASSHTGFCYEEANKETDHTKLKQFIGTQYRVWKTTGLSGCDTNKEYIASFGYDRIASNVYNVFLTFKN